MGLLPRGLGIQHLADRLLKLAETLANPMGGRLTEHWSRTGKSLTVWCSLVLAGARRERTADCPERCGTPPPLSGLRER